MFKLENIVSANKFFLGDKTLTRELKESSMAIVVSRRTGDHFVFLNAPIYQELLDNRLLLQERHREIMEAYLPRGANLGKGRSNAPLL